MNTIELAKKAGFEVVDGELRLYFDGSNALLKPNRMGTVVDGLKEFAAIVRAEALEEAAKLCEDHGGTLHQWTDKRKTFAAAIRARSEK